MSNFTFLAERTHIEHLKILCAPFDECALRAKGQKVSINKSQENDIGLVDISRGLIFLVSGTRSQGPDMETCLKAENKDGVGASDEDRRVIKTRVHFWVQNRGRFL